MSFKDELVDIITTAAKEVEQEQREEQEFESQWDKFRKSAIWPLFKDAAAAFRTTHIGGDCSLQNGSIILEAKFHQEGQRFRHRLAFKPDKVQRQIICTSSLEDAPETFTLDALTGEVIREQVKRFARAVAGGKKLSVYDERLRDGKPLLTTF